MFGKKYFRAFAICILLNFLFNTTGLYFIILYSKNIYKQAGVDDPELWTLIMGIINIFGVVISSATVSHLSRLKFILFGLLMQTLAHVIFLIGIKADITFMIILGVIWFTFFFYMTSGSVFYVYVTEITPPLGLSLGSIIRWVMAILIGKFAENMVDAMGLFNVFLILMIITIAGFVILLIIGIEN